MMQTCRTLRVYEAGVPLLLAPGVTIRRVRCLASFWAFMLADATRFRYIRCLRLDHWDRFPRSKRLGQALACVLQHAYSLEELALSHSEFLNRYPKVANAIVTMTSLKTFSLLHDDCMSPQRLVDMLRKMKSPRPKIPCLSLDFSSALYEDHVEPLQVLEGMSQHLEQLSVGYGAFDPEYVLPFPQMKVLSLDVMC